MFRRSAVVVAAATMVVAVSALAGDEPSAAELRQQIESLQRTVDRIEQREATHAAQTASRVEVLADAERRSQLLQSDGIHAGWDGKNFFLGSADGTFTLKSVFQFQFRNATNWRSNATGDGDDWENGFETRRLKFGVQGNVFSKDLSYKLVWQTNRQGGAVTPEETWVRYKLSNEFAVRAGQFKDPLNRESLVSSAALLSTERSYQTDIFFGSDNCVQGVALAYDNGGPVRAEAAFTDGSLSINGNFQDPPVGTDANFGIAARADYLLFGDWKALNDFRAAGVQTDSLVIGAAADYTEGEQATAGTQRVIRYTADVLYKLASRWSLYSAINGRFTDISDGETRSDWGGLVQVAWSPDDKIEPFARYGYTLFDNPPAGFDGAVHEITAGANYYFYGQNAKFTLELTYLPTGAAFADSGADLLASTDAQCVLRGQFQLAF